MAGASMLPYEAGNFGEQASLAWLDRIPRLSTITTTSRERTRARLRALIWRGLGRPHRQPDPGYPPLHNVLVQRLKLFLSLTDYQRINDDWESLRVGILKRTPPARRHPTDLELSTVSTGNLLYHNLLFYQITGEALEAEEEAVSEYERLSTLNPAAPRVATPWTDAVRRVSTDQPGKTFKENVRELTQFGDRCHYFHCSRTRQDYEDDESLSREEAHTLPLRDPWQLVAQERWETLAGRLTRDIHWLERRRIYHTAGEQQHSAVAVHRLKMLRDTIFVDITETRQVGGPRITSFEVKKTWLSPGYNVEIGPD